MRTREVEEGEKYLKQLMVSGYFQLLQAVVKAALAKKKKTTIRTLPHTQGTQSLKMGRN